MSCLVTPCIRPSYARGWCRTHYDRWRKYGDPLGGPPVHPRHRYTPADRVRILDVLGDDGGWLTIEGIQLVLTDLSTVVIERVLDRELAYHRVKKREVELASASKYNRSLIPDMRVEYRI